MYPPPPPQPPPAKMSTGAKVALVVGVLIVGACAVCVGAGVVGGYWVKQQAPAMMDDVRGAVREARAFGQAHAQADCVPEGVRRATACGQTEFRCAMRASAFLNACVRAATASQGFCDRVPPSREMAGSAQWRADTCAAQGRPNDPRCSNVLTAVQGYCDRPGPLPPELDGADAGR